ncbi:methionine--tRNA ligase [Bacillus pinisoli]|uniref:methionine--tRNA ligase n=1 Tax=Bacillus pinisoli TaxID=2901866 RepID=UPI001FF425EA|nr:methionine--tRNA ligase [Bacillus pinisoli]
MAVFIGGAWPYANGSLHLGHVSSLLPGDVLARYFRIKGEKVLYVSGSDCNGTPIAIRASQEGKNVEEITDYYHDEFVKCFNKLGFTYDLYTRTDHEYHHKAVKDIFKDLVEKDLIYRKKVDQSYCNECHQFLPDRYVEGICPHCRSEARGDQCDHCSSILDPLELLDRRCKLCGLEPIIKETEHFYFALSKFQEELSQLVERASQEGEWRRNAVMLTKRYLVEGLHDRAVTRDLSIGVSVPITGYEDKKIYVWIEAVSGYLSASKQWADVTGHDWQDFWERNVKSYYIHGKDNIPFHTIIWPAILLGLENLALPSHIISNEYVTIEQKKISTSKNYAVWLPDLLDSFHPDTIRYYVTINGPETKDANFSWQDFVHSHNGELLGAYGNFVNRTLKFIGRAFNNKVPSGVIEPAFEDKLSHLYVSVGEKLECGELKSSIEEIFHCIRDANKFFDAQKPWLALNEDITNCQNTLYTCVQIIANLSNLLSPFLPFSADQLRIFLGICEPRWNYIEVDTGTTITVEILFERILPSVIEQQRNKLGLV